MSATCVLWFVPRGNTRLSKHGNPVFPQFAPLNHNLAHLDKGGGGMSKFSKRLQMLWGIISTHWHVAF